MRLPSFLVVALALAAACKPTHTQTPHTAASADVEGKTVALVTASNGIAKAYCSGVWVADDAFLTANHCLSDTVLGEPVAYVTRGDISAADADELAVLRIGKLVALDADHDLALVKVKFAPSHGTATLAPDDPETGQPVQTMGHPLGLWYSYSQGNVAAVRAMDLDDTGTAIWFVQSTAPISPGNSGGGLFDTDGRLMGVCHAYFPRGENLNLYVHVKYVRMFLKGQGA